MKINKKIVKTVICAVVIAVIVFQLVCVPVFYRLTLTPGHNAFSFESITQTDGKSKNKKTDDGEK